MAASAFDVLKRTANQVQHHIQTQLQQGVDAERTARDLQYQQQFRLSPSEKLINEIPCELSISNSSAGSGFWSGRLYLSPTVRFSV